MRGDGRNERLGIGSFEKILGPGGKQLGQQRKVLRGRRPENPEGRSTESPGA